MTTSPNYHDILGVRVTSSRMSEVLDKIEEKAGQKASDRPYFIVTAYSEFFLNAQIDADFRHALAQADLIVGDGVSVWAAVDYLRGSRGNFLTKMGFGLTIGLNVLLGKYKDRVVGVELFSKLLASKYKMFLLGGWNGVSGKLSVRYKTKFYQGPIDIARSSKEENELILKKVNAHNPDILFVSFGQYKQEKWIASNLDKIKAKVVIGVGSAFDEVLGEGIWRDKAPKWVETMGLKWLWRAVKNPRHLKRAWNAFPVFAWRVFMSSLKV